MFGTIGGVFTPSILTILGVIMYLRLGWVVKNVKARAVHYNLLSNKGEIAMRELNNSR